MAEQNILPSRRRLEVWFRSRDFWLWLVVLLLVTVLHFGGAAPLRVWLAGVSLQLTPCLVERLLFLVPVAFATVKYGAAAGALTVVLSLFIMLFRLTVGSCQPDNALRETTGVLSAAILLTWILSRLRTEQQAREDAERIGLEQLRASEARYRGLFESASDAIWVQDGKGRLVAANVACGQLIGYELDELVGQPAGKFLPKTVPAGRHEVVLRHKDGHEVVVELVAHPIPADSDSPNWEYMARDVTERRRREEATRLFAQRVVRAQEEERRRVARELHDGTVQTLVALSNRLEALAVDGSSVPPEIAQRISNMRHVVRDAANEARRFSQNLRPPALDDLGLLPSLEDMAAELRREHGLAVEVQALGQVRRLQPEAELTLFRIVQEALSNVHRHAQASEAIVHVVFSEDMVRVTVRDDGQGVDLPERLSDLATSGCLGLAGIRERAHLLGGKASIRSEPGQGTAVRVELPV